jgi:uncharacterized membrane protein YtjA (UPF0391 family)
LGTEFAPVKTQRASAKPPVGTAFAIHLQEFTRTLTGDFSMLRAAIVFFVIALIAMFLGLNNIAGISAEAGKLLLFVFLALAVISFVVSLFSGRRSGPRL